MGAVTYEGLRTPDDPRRQWSTKSAGEETDEARRLRLHRAYWRLIALGLDSMADEFASQWFRRKS